MADLGGELVEVPPLDGLQPDADPRAVQKNPEVIRVYLGEDEC